MRNIILILMLLLNINIYSQDSKLLASCCEGEKTETKSLGRCSGTASCRACSSCRYCKHCSNGGTCGVCSSYSSPPPTTKKKTNNYSSEGSSNSYYKSPSSYSYDDYLMVRSETLNVREGAGTEYDIVEKIDKGDLLKFISYSGDWIKVKVIRSGNTGYVYYKYVN